MHLFVINLIAIGESVLGINFSRLALRITAAANSGDPSWETLCEECVEEPFIRLQTVGFSPDLLVFEENLDEGKSVYVVEKGYSGGYATNNIARVGGDTFYIHEIEVINGNWIDGTLSWGGAYWGADTLPCDLPSLALGVYFGYTGDKIRITVSNDPCPAPGWVDPAPGYGDALENTVTSLVIAATQIGGSGAYRALTDPIAASFTVTSVSVNHTPAFMSYVDEAGTHEGAIPVGASITRFYYSDPSVQFTLTIGGVSNE